MRQGELEISRQDLWLCLLWGGVMSGFTSACFIVASRHIVAAELTIFMLLEFAQPPRRCASASVRKFNRRSRLTPPCLKE